MNRFLRHPPMRGAFWLTNRIESVYDKHNAKKLRSRKTEGMILHAFHDRAHGGNGALDFSRQERHTCNRAKDADVNQRVEACGEFVQRRSELPYSYARKRHAWTYTHPKSGGGEPKRSSIDRNEARRSL